METAVPAAVSPRIGLVGCGTVGELHTQRLLAEGVEIVAICDPDAEALDRMTQLLPQRPRLFRTEQDLLAAGIADAVVLCTPHGRHARQIATALEADAHVLCEKPFVSQRAEGEALVQMARHRNRALFVSYYRRCRGHARFLISSASTIGPLQQIVIVRSQPWYQRFGWTWRMREEEGGGFLRDAGASMLDLILQLNATPLVEASAELGRPGGVGVDIRAQVRLRFVSGCRAELTLLGDATESLEWIQLFGENGTAGWFQREGGTPELYLRLTHGTEENPDPVRYRTASPDRAFIAALRSGRCFDSDSAPDLYDAATALPVVGLLEDLYRDAHWS